MGNEINISDINAAVASEQRRMQDATELTIEMADLRRNHAIYDIVEQLEKQCAELCEANRLKESELLKAKRESRFSKVMSIISVIIAIASILVSIFLR